MLWCFTDALFHNSVSLSWSRKTKKPLSNAEGSEMTHLILLKWLHSYCLSVSLKTLILPVEVCKGLEWFEGKHKMDHRWDENGCIAALFISLPYLAGGWRLLLTPWFIEKISFLLISQGRSGSRTILLFGFWCEKNWFLKSYKPRYTVRFAAYHFICKIYITAWRLSGHKACKPTPKSNI